MLIFSSIKKTFLSMSHISFLIIQLLFHHIISFCCPFLHSQFQFDVTPDNLTLMIVVQTSSVQVPVFRSLSGLL